MHNALRQVILGRAFQHVMGDAERGNAHAEWPWRSGIEGDMAVFGSEACRQALVGIDPEPVKGLVAVEPRVARREQLGCNLALTRREMLAPGWAAP